MAYSLDNLTNDCANKKSRTDLPMKEKKKVLGEVWEAFNLWIDSQFEKGKVSFDTLQAHALNFGQL
jgi:hypothetical protein